MNAVSRNDRSDSENAEALELKRFDLESFEQWQIAQRNEGSPIIRALSDPKLARLVFSLSAECLYRSIGAAVPEDFDWWFEMRRDGESRVLFKHRDATDAHLREITDYDAYVLVALLEGYDWPEVRRDLLRDRVEQLPPAISESEFAFEQARAEARAKREAQANLCRQSV